MSHRRHSRPDRHRRVSSSSPPSSPSPSPPSARYRANRVSSGERLRTRCSRCGRSVLRPQHRSPFATDDDTHGYRDHLRRPARQEDRRAPPPRPPGAAAYDVAAVSRRLRSGIGLPGAPPDDPRYRPLGGRSRDRTQDAADGVRLPVSTDPRAARPGPAPAPCQPAQPRTPSARDPKDAFCVGATPLPDWLAGGNSAAVAAERVRYALLETARDGDCLFHSVHLVLASARPESVPTTAQLRAQVAATVLDTHDARSAAVMASWRDRLEAALRQQDKELEAEFRHAQPLLHDDVPFSAGTRRRLYESMCDPSIYWGDQYALEVLEALYGVRLLVASPRGFSGAPVGAVVQFGLHRAPGFRPRWCGVLCLRGGHYRPLVRPASGGRYVAAFSVDDLPSFLPRA